MYTKVFQLPLAERMIATIYDDEHNEYLVIAVYLVKKRTLINFVLWKGQLPNRGAVLQQPELPFIHALLFREFLQWG